MLDMIEHANLAERNAIFIEICRKTNELRVKKLKPNGHKNKKRS